MNAPALVYLDANALIACVVNVAGADATARMRRLAKTGTRLQASPLAEYEARKHLHFRQVADWEADLDGFLLNRRLADEWRAAIAQALRLARDFRARLAVDSADTLHVGWALSIGADVFASFDRASGPRALALCCGLKLYPEPEEKDFAALRRLKP